MSYDDAHLSPELQEAIFGNSKLPEPNHEVTINCPRCGDEIKSRVIKVERTAIGTYDIDADPEPYVLHMIDKHREIVPEAVIAEYEED